MNTIGRQEIIDHHFDKKRRGYDPTAVDRFLERVAEQVQSLQNKLERQSTDRAALELLKNAERIAGDTRLGAEIDARRLRETSAGELEQARVEAAGIVEQGRAEAATILGEAGAEATSIISQANGIAAAIHEAAAQQSGELEQRAQAVRQFIADSAADLRLASSRLAEMADHYDYSLPTRNDAIGLGERPDSHPADTTGGSEAPIAESVASATRPLLP